MTLVGEESDVYGFVLVEQERRGTLGTLILRCEDNIETDFRRKIWKCTNYINLAQYTDQCLTITNEVQKNVS